MYIYIPMIIFTSSLALYIPTIYNKKIKLVGITKIFIFLPPFLVLALRYGIGTDYFYTYVPVFESLSKGYSYEGVELGYILLNKFILFFTEDYYWLFIITAFIFCYFILRSIFEQSKYIGISIYIFLTAGLYFYSMNVMRQTIGFAIFLYALKYIKLKNLKKYLIYMIIATSIHKSSVIYLPIYFIANLKIDYKKFIFITILIFISKQYTLELIEFILRGSKYHNYISGYYRDTSQSMISPMINFIIIIIFYIFYKKYNNYCEYKAYLNIHLCAFWISLYIGTIPLISRVFIGFYHIQILSIPYLIYLLKYKDRKIIATIITFIFFGIIFLYSIGIKNGNGVLPYKSIFSVIS